MKRRNPWISFYLYHNFFKPISVLGFASAALDDKVNKTIKVLNEEDVVINAHFVVENSAFSAFFSKSESLLRWYFNVDVEFLRRWLSVAVEILVWLFLSRWQYTVYNTVYKLYKWNYSMFYNQMEWGEPRLSFKHSMEFYHRFESKPMLS